MLKAYKYRLYPTPDQANMIDRTIGVCRFVYNLALETKITAWKSAGISLSAYDLQRQIIGLREICPWIGDVSRRSVDDSVLKIDTAFKGFFTGKGYPSFKKKSRSGSFRITGDPRRINWERKTLTITKLKDIPIELSRRFDGEIRTVTISRSATGKYFASILVDNKILLPTKTPVVMDSTIGIDIGIKSFAVTSNGKSFEPNRYLKNSLQRLKCLQSRASRKKKGGNNRKKANLRVAILHEKIANQRADYIHKITTGLIRDNQAETFVIEDLNVSGMMKNRKISQAIRDVSFGEFFRQMRYKCEWYGKNLIKIGRFEPSSKTCSNCGHLKQDLALSDREWTCESCGSAHDRDLNAAKNIKAMGLEQYSRLVEPVEPVERRRLRRAKKQELCILDTQTPMFGQGISD